MEFGKGAQQPRLVFGDIEAGGHNEFGWRGEWIGEEGGGDVVDAVVDNAYFIGREEVLLKGKVFIIFGDGDHIIGKGCD